MDNNEEDKFFKKAGNTILRKVIESVPGGDIATAAFDLINEGKRAIDNDKFHNFIMGIQEYDEGDIDLSNESFIALVKRLYLDDESSKTDMYARLAVALAKSQLNDSEKIHYINILSNLAYADIQLARKYYIYSQYEVDSSGCIEEQLSSLSDTQDGVVLKGIQSLITNGLTYESKINRTLPYEYNVPTQSLINFIGYIFDDKDLNPESIGESCNKINSVDIFIFSANKTKANRTSYNNEISENYDFSHEENNKYNNVLSEITQAIHSEDINYKIGDQYSFERYRNSARLLIYIEGDVPDYFKNIINEEKVRKKIVIKFQSVPEVRAIGEDTIYINFDIKRLEESKKNLIDVISESLA
ncbi:hypothetical protein [Proteus mirabilis]|uniref:hypothetical protein n=1 Tax=Proteus mirabilis TaxID=584 RepID=UPI0034D4DAAE